MDGKETAVYVSDDGVANYASGVETLTFKLCLEGQGDLLSRLITPITHIITPIIPIINLVIKSP